ncbi:hypothetical protein EN829_032190 [Mesorhizobium sp. M00.F.Ca.ET.186.01.1.1]|nr:hypothetical protein EN848_32290 [bacterium M00.F.Ca.ET.205.01.1.1]TGU46112.1 hypothetical protein EN795_32630 [bacterium M00.F.Ca.ET.152.01.1.1]TGV31565.1 hypothetical protein EN829_032190 [Mesorhizobium sp. M00.F.Ca.ET.186.01.1.1]TGZ38730.1 hypothetical protein EN805_32235 [bacterium M00.F.Ca.ET.162.01.1.1]TIV29187.1 MAG: hypothetical protein E5V90_13435 [Mesorhizobium sp.]
MNTFDRAYFGGEPERLRCKPSKRAGLFVPVQDAGNQVIIGYENQLPEGCQDVGRSAVELSAPLPRRPQFGADAANPMDQ